MSEFEQIDPSPVQDNKGFFMNTVLPLLYVMGLSTGIASSFYYITNKVLSYIQGKLVSSIQIYSSDPLFEIILEYIQTEKFEHINITNLLGQFQKKKKKWYEDYFQKDDTQQKKPVECQANTGNILIYHKNTLIQFYFQRGEIQATGYSKNPSREDFISLTTYGTQKMKVVKEMIDESLRYAKSKEKKTVNIYSQKWSSWQKSTSKQGRDFESVVLDENKAEYIVEDLKNFLSNQKWYQERGVPYRRGYLLYGPPGTGKSSIISVISSKLGLNLCCLNLTNKQLDDDNLNNLLETTPKKSILLLEDIDAIFSDRTKIQTGNQMLTFSGLLNALDGVRSLDGRIVFMTTNHKEKLDPALLRPGRADVHIKLDNASENQARRLFLKFFPGKEEHAKKFSHLLPEFKVSMAKLQGLFLKYSEDPQLPIDHINEITDETYSFQKEMGIIDWLLRIGLERHAYLFYKEDIRRVQDLQYVGEGDLEGTFKIKTIGLRQRFMGVLNGKQDMIKQFQLMTGNRIRTFIPEILNKSYSEEVIEKIIKMIPENLISEFQFRHIIDKQLVIDENKLLDDIMKLVKRNQQFEKNPTLKSIYEKERHKIHKTVKFDRNFIKEIENLGYKNVIKALQEHQMDKVEQFVEVDENVLNDPLGIKNIGQVKNVMKIINDVKQEFEKEKEKCDQYEEEDDFDYEDFSEFIDDLSMKKTQSTTFARKQKRQQTMI